MLRPLILVLVVGAIAGCYRPRVEGACEVGCEFGVREQCPNSLTCGQDNLCYDETPCFELPADGGVDSGIDTPDAGPGCFNTFLLGLVCPTPTTVRGAVVYSAGGINTDLQGTCTEIIGTTNEVCLIAAETISISSASDIRVIGSRPLALYGRLSVTVSGRLDASAGGAGFKPETDATSCESPSGRSQMNGGEASGGGAGGTMVARGGNGGEPNGLPFVLAPIATTITTLRAGCSGGRGGNRANGGLNGGTAGLGGGALQIISPGTVDITGIVDAYGNGGGGGQGATGQAAGGGGGGSGGLIAVDAATIVIHTTAMMRAHGGGGGGGANESNAGGNGGAGNGANGAAAIGGTNGGANSGKGGNGSSDSVKVGDPGADVTAASGAGGGGGAAGAILFRAGTTNVIVGAQIHPTPAVSPL